MTPGNSTVEVSNQLIEQMGDDWSEPVEFKFVRLSDGTVDMVFRYVLTPTLRNAGGPVEALRETR